MGGSALCVNELVSLLREHFEGQGYECAEVAPTAELKRGLTFLANRLDRRQCQLRELEAPEMQPEVRYIRRCIIWLKLPM